MLTAVIIAIGTGTYAGLGGTSAWRLRSQDASYEQLRYRDLHVRLPTGTDVPEGDLRAAVAGIADADQVEAVAEQLVATVQVDASTDDEAILVPGEVVGLEPDADVDLLHVADGRAPEGAGEVVLEAKFANARDLPDTGTLAVSGGQRVTWTGVGFTPTHFQVLGSTQQVTGADGYAVVYAPLATAQTMTDRPGRVTEAMVRLRDGADVDAVADQVEEALAGVGATVETPDDDTVRRSLYADARNDDKMWIALSLLVLSGASFAAFNLVTRMVDAERREIGVAMALGAPTSRLAIRPLLVGAQIAVAGVLLGFVVGALTGGVMRGLLTSFLPLPVWETPFPVGRYAQAAVLGVVLPVVATAIPVRRALRVQPVDALRSQALSVRPHGGAARGLGRPRRRGRIVATLPVRNVARSLRRTLLTALGIAASITTLVAVLGLLDSLHSTFGRSDDEVGRVQPDRLEIALSTFQPAGSDVVEAVSSSPTVGSATAALRVGGTMRHGGTDVDTIIDLVDFGDPDRWSPSVTSGTRPAGEAGLVISEKAASDLGVSAGDRITLEHPRRDGLSYRMVESEVTVAGIHPNPLRFFSYVDTSQADLFDLEGIVNMVVAEPAPGRSVTEVQRALFEESGVASVVEVAVLGVFLEDQVARFTGVLRILQAFGLVLALLITLNSATLSMEERRREQATMFAFGLPVRTVLRTIVVETFLIAVLGTLLGLVSGYLALRWLLHMFTTETFPELGVLASLSPTSVMVVMVLGVGVASAAPLLAVRRLLRTDIPSTLRVLE